jgi:hypothetical protein
MTSNHRAGYGTETDKIDALIAWLRKYPDATLASGQAKLLLQRIDEYESRIMTAVQIAYVEGYEARVTESEAKINGK